MGKSKGGKPKGGKPKGGKPNAGIKTATTDKYGNLICKPNNDARGCGKGDGCERSHVCDVMMASGVEEKAVQHNRCRMVCSGCLCEKRAFRPPPMFCEKCYQAIHSRWSYWEESGEECGIKLCKPSPWNVREISRIIDKMPMRRQEMRAGG